MNDAYNIPHSGARLVWVFDYDGHADTLDKVEPQAFAEALGLSTPPIEESIEWFDVDTLETYGLSRYLSEANGFDVGADAEKLDALSSGVVLIFSDGIAPEDTGFSPEAPFQLIGRYGMPIDLPPIVGIESDSAKGQLPQGKPPKSSARISGMVATFVLIFLAIFVAIFVWIGG